MFFVYSVLAVVGYHVSAGRRTAVGCLFVIRASSVFGKLVIGRVRHGHSLHHVVT